MAQIGNSPININNPEFFNQGVYGVSTASHIGLPNNDLIRPEDSQILTEVGNRYLQTTKSMDQELMGMIEPSIRYPKNLTPLNALNMMRSGAQYFQNSGHGDAAQIVSSAANDNNTLFEIRAQLLGA